jgi:hypothetical protein
MMCSSQMGKGGKARGTKAPSQLKEWEHWDLNPDQRVSSMQGATLQEYMGLRSS